MKNLDNFALIEACLPSIDYVFVREANLISNRLLIRITRRLS
jgi:hypothetical protein